MKIRITPCGIRHLAEATALFEQYRQFYGMPADIEGARAFLHDRLTLEDSIFLMATNERGTPVGFTQLYPLFSSTRMVKLWLLNDLFVASHARRAGVGRRLMDAAKEQASQHGVRVLALATEKHNLPAKQLYESLGYQLDTEFDHYELPL